MQFPENVLTARFQAHPFCERKGQAGGASTSPSRRSPKGSSASRTCDPPIATDGFDEFGMSFQIPEDLQLGDELLFPAVQVYSSGERSAG